MAPSCGRLLLLVWLSCFLLSVVIASEKQHEKRTNHVYKNQPQNSLNLRDIGARKYPTDRRSVLDRRQVGEANLARYEKHRPAELPGKPKAKPTSNNYESAGIYTPGDPAPAFTLPTLDGIVTYPGEVLTARTPLLLHAYTPHSAFLRCAWNCSGSLEALVENSPNDTHYIFISYGDDAYENSLWMKARFKAVVLKVEHAQNRSKPVSSSLLSRLHFVTLPLYQLGNWIPAVFKQWTCSGHNCGLDQAVFSTSGSSPLIAPRLDARYDWLPMFPTGKPYNLSDAQDGCRYTPGVKGQVALVTASGCSYFTKVQMMEKSGAVGVVVLQNDSSCPQDMNCDNTTECSTPLGIPATMVSDLGHVNRASLRTVTFQNTVWDNFFFGVDSNGSLAEAGWFLYPSFHFLAWQAQWFGYMEGLRARLAEKAFVISVLNDTIMQGNAGASASLRLPPMSKLMTYSTFELDLHLSCPGTADTTCPHWDHTVQLFVCCNASSVRCGAELGRWISPFRRRIGRWLTNVTSLLPLLDGDRCTLTLKTVPWAMAWKPSLNLRFSGLRAAKNPPPYMVIPLYKPGATFDRNYNTHFPPYSFKLPPNISKVEILAVITGHGSDENGCGEFCVTSHHFVVNDSPAYNKTFDIAGSPLGCADQVPYGAEPNEHGTWLYGRDGWCDGQDVTPWVIDVTNRLSRTAVNTIRYYGWFNGTDPSPKQSPGEMIVYSYVVLYKD